MNSAFQNIQNFQNPMDCGEVTANTVRKKWLCQIWTFPPILCTTFSNTERCSLLCVYQSITIHVDMPKVVSPTRNASPCWKLQSDASVTKMGHNPFHQPWINDGGCTSKIGWTGSRILSNSHAVLLGCGQTQSKLTDLQRKLCLRNHSVTMQRSWRSVTVSIQYPWHCVPWWFECVATINSGVYFCHFPNCVRHKSQNTFPGAELFSESESWFSVWRPYGVGF